MNQKIRKALAILSAVILTGSSMAMQMSQVPSVTASAKTLKEIEQEKKEKQAQIDAKKEEISKLADDISSKSAYEQALKDEVELINGKLLLIDSQMTSVIGDIAAKQEEIARLQEEIDAEQYEVQEGLKLFKKRIRTLYVHGNDSLLSALVGASSFYDVLAKIDVIKRISEHDDKMIDKLEQDIRALTEHQKDLTASVQALNIKQTEIEVLQDEFQNSREELDATISGTDIEIYELTKQQYTANDQLKTHQAEMEQIDEEQQEIIAEALRKIEEEERKRKEAEEKRKAAEEARRTTTTTTVTTTTTTTTTAPPPVITSPPVVVTEAPAPAVTQAPAPAVTQAPQTQAPVVTEPPAPVTQAPVTDPPAPPTTKATTATTAAPQATIPSGYMFAWPAPGNYIISSYFGLRTDPFGSGATTGHGGIDIIGPTSASGGPACAAGNGTVAYVCNNGWGGGYGNHVVISHGNGYSTLYAHLQRTTVSVGQQVTVGQQVGVIGRTGQVTGPHLHFEVRLNNNRVNPLNYVPH